VDIIRQVVTAKDREGKIIATVTDYYDRFVHSLGEKYRKSSFTKDRLVLCPFHSDVNPSMGLIKDRLDKQVEIFHCFGCGASGDVVRFHRRFVFISEGRNISIDVAARELASLYGIEISEQRLEDELKSLLHKKEVEIEKNLGKYDFRSHSANLLKLRSVQDQLSIKELAENIDVILNKWKMVIKN
jgi:DNA primase